MRELTYVEATVEALDSAMARDPSIFVVGEGIGERGGNFNTTVGLFAKYGPERLCDTPISERGFVGMCAGAAMTGTRPVVDFMFFDFILDAFGELVNQIAKMQYMSSGRIKMPILLRGAIGIGPLGCDPPLWQLLPDLCPSARISSGGACYSKRRQGSLRHCAAERRPSALFGTQIAAL